MGSTNAMYFNATEFPNSIVTQVSSSAKSNVMNVDVTDFSESLNVTQMPDGTECTPSFLYTTLNVIFCLITVSGNMPVVLYMSNNQQYSSNFNVYITALAFADLTVGFNALLQLSQTLCAEWTYAISFCVPWKIVDYSLTSVSMLLLDAIAYDRYRSVATPIIYRTHFTRRRSIIISVAMWILGFVLWTPIIIAQQFNDEYKVTTIKECLIGYGYFTVGQVVFSYYIPILFLIVMSGLTLRTLVKRDVYKEFRRKKQSNGTAYVIEYQANHHETEAREITGDLQNAPVESNVETHPIQVFDEGKSSDGKVSEGNQVGRIAENTKIRNKSVENRKINAQNRKCFKTMSVIVVVFLACWIPYSIELPIRAFCGYECFPHVVDVIFSNLTYLNSSINPLIYVFTSEVVRSGMANFVRCRRTTR